MCTSHSLFPPNSPIPQYVVDIYPFKVAGFVPASQDRLLRTDIVITSNYGDGPRPRAYMPPGYIADRERKSFIARIFLSPTPQVTCVQK